MGAHRGSPDRRQREETHGETDGRWLAALFVVALHAALYLLLRAPAELASVPASDRIDKRIRLVWSMRERLPRSTAKVPVIAVPRAAATTSAHHLPAIATAIPRREPIVETHESDDWSLPSKELTGGKEGEEADAGFTRDVFAHQGADPFAPSNHLPDVRLHDSSFGGRLQAEARRKACGSLRGALAGKPESTAAIIASMRRWHCAL